MYGHTLGAAVALGYIEARTGLSDDYVREGRYEILLDKRRIPARASLTPMYDPKSARVRT
jgi:glycine cleavage system aminomethyltransferase T